MQHQPTPVSPNSSPEKDKQTWQAPTISLLSSQDTHGGKNQTSLLETRDPGYASVGMS